MRGCWAVVIAGLLILAGSIYPVAPGFAAEVPPLPWTRYSELQGRVAPSGMASCATGTISVGRIGEEWWVAVSETRDMWVHQPTGATEPDFVYYSVGTANVDRFTVQEALPFVESKAKYPSPCDWFDRGSAF